MMTLLRHPLAGVTAAAIVLVGLLGAMVVDRMWLITHGREVVLKIQPYDPRDMFKGDYVQLAYTITRIDDPKLQTAIAAAARRGQRDVKLFVVLELTDSGEWKAVSISPDLPRDLPARQVAIAGMVARNGGLLTPVRYGIERYFVPEGTGPRLEDLARKSQLSAVVAVDKQGRAAIKGLLHEGRRIDTAPLL